jgi:hypothetical protein
MALAGPSASGSVETSGDLSFCVLLTIFSSDVFAMHFQGQVLTISKTVKDLGRFRDYNNMIEKMHELGYDTQTYLTKAVSGHATLLNSNPSRWTPAKNRRDSQAAEAHVARLVQTEVKQQVSKFKSDYAANNNGTGKNGNGEKS